MRAHNLIGKILEATEEMTDSGKASIYGMMLESIAESIRTVPSDLLVCELAEDLSDLVIFCGINSLTDEEE